MKNDEVTMASAASACDIHTGALAEECANAQDVSSDQMASENIIALADLEERMLFDIVQLGFKPDDGVADDIPDHADRDIETPGNANPSGESHFDRWTLTNIEPVPTSFDGDISNHPIGIASPFLDCIGTERSKKMFGPSVIQVNENTEGNVCGATAPHPASTRAPNGFSTSENDNLENLVTLQTTMYSARTTSQIISITQASSAIYTTTIPATVTYSAFNYSFADPTDAGPHANTAQLGSNDEISLNGSAGNDTLIGGAGDDNIFGGRGDDQMFGAEGDDYFRDRSGSDLFAVSYTHLTLPTTPYV